MSLVFAPSIWRGKAMDIAGGIDHHERAAIAPRENVTGRLKRIDEGLCAVRLAIAGGDDIPPFFDGKPGKLGHGFLGLVRALAILEPLCAPVLRKTGRQLEPESSRKLARAAPQLLPVVREVDRLHARKVDTRPDDVAVMPARLDVKEHDARLAAKAQRALDHGKRLHELLAAQPGRRIDKSCIDALARPGAGGKGIELR